MNSSYKLFFTAMSEKTLYEILYDKTTFSDDGVLKTLQKKIE